MTKRSELCRTRRTLFISNYKMLDLLLQREDDLPIWAAAELAYVILDEFHTHDRAQGTDMAMLLHRLSAALGVTTTPIGRFALRRATLVAARGYHGGRLDREAGTCYREASLALTN